MKTIKISRRQLVNQETIFWQDDRINTGQIAGLVEHK